MGRTPCARGSGVERRETPGGAVQRSAGSRGRPGPRPPSRGTHPSQRSPRTPQFARTRPRRQAVFLGSRGDRGLQSSVGGGTDGPHLGGRTCQLPSAAWRWAPWPGLRRGPGFSSVISAPLLGGLGLGRGWGQGPRSGWGGENGTCEVPLCWGSRQAVVPGQSLVPGLSSGPEAIALGFSLGNPTRSEQQENLLGVPDHKRHRLYDGPSKPNHSQ